MKKLKLLFILTMVVVSMDSLVSCKRKKVDSSSFSSNYVEKFKDERAILTYHEETDSYSFKMDQMYKNTLYPIIIPSTYKEKKVTEIEEDAFKDFEYVSELSFSSNIIKFGKNSLKGCYRLQKLNIPFIGESKNNNRFLGYLFGEERYLSYSLIPPYLNTITITNEDYIPDGAFYGFEGLRNITLNDGIKSIGKDAFNRCNNLAYIKLPNTISSFGDNAFKDCENLMEVMIPNNIKNIGEDVFKNCKKLKLNKDEESRCYYLGNNENKYLYLLNIDENETILTPHASCRIISLDNVPLGKITTINITKDVHYIKLNSSNGWDELDNVSVHSENETYDSRKNCSAIIETKTNTLIFGTINTILPNNISSITSEAFSNKILGLTSSKSFVIPNSVTFIGSGAFEGCTGLRNVTFGTGMKIIPDNIFNGCENLRRVVIPNCYEVIGKGAFSGCSHLEALYFGCSYEEYQNGKISMDNSTKSKFELVNKFFNWDKEIDNG